MGYGRVVGPVPHLILGPHLFCSGGSGCSATLHLVGLKHFGLKRFRALYENPDPRGQGFEAPNARGQGFKA